MMKLTIIWFLESYCEGSAGRMKESVGPDVAPGPRFAHLGPNLTLAVTLASALLA